MKKSEGQDLKKQVFVVGAGASGLMAAIQAAINGAAVTVLEQNDRPGRKICATGNGRCNLLHFFTRLDNNFLSFLDVNYSWLHSSNSLRISSVM